MANEFLSQDEVDALLKGVSSEAEEQPDKAPEAVRSYNIGTQDRIVRGHMPTLEIINSRFARLLRTGLFEFMRRMPEVSASPVKMVKYGDLTRGIAMPTNLNIVQMRPLRGNTLIVIDPGLIFCVVDHLFGGSGNLHARVDGRDFTPTEYRIIRRMLGIVMEEYRKCWQPVHPVEFEFVRSEMHAQFAGICTATEIVVVSSFKVSLDSGGGMIQICIPYSTIEPIRETLYSSAQGDNLEPDRRWAGMLKKQVQSAEVEMVAQLAHIPVSIQQILNMNAGDVLSVDMPERVVVDVEGVPIFDCHYGTSNGKYALKVDRILAVSPRDNMLGEERA